MTKRYCFGFSLIELLVTVVVVSTLTLTILPALASVRDKSENEQSRANLMELGQGRDQYALDNKDRIFTYSWIPGETYMLPDGRSVSGNSWQDAAARQNQEIIMRRTGRISGATKITSMNGRLPHRRFTHLVLMDYLAGDDDVFFSGQLAIDPADQNRLVWNENPLSYGFDSGVPYSYGNPSGYDEGSFWSQSGLLQRWAFTSSYEVVPFAWQPDGPDDVYIPVSTTPNLYGVNGSGSVDLSGRTTSEVAFPSQKVHMHEDHDREQKRYPWFAYDHAQVEKLMFDGSLNAQPSGEANDSYSPAMPDTVWRQRYVPLEHFPIPLGGFNDPAELNMRFRWTQGGLQGTDYD